MTSLACIIGEGTNLDNGLYEPDKDSHSKDMQNDKLNEATDLNTESTLLYHNKLYMVQYIQNQHQDNLKIIILDTKHYT